MNIFAHLNLLIFGSHTYTGSTETPTVVVILKPQMWGRPSQPPLGRHCCSLCLQVLPLSLFSPNIDFINEVFSSIRILSGQQWVSWWWSWATTTTRRRTWVRSKGWSIRWSSTFPDPLFFSASFSAWLPPQTSRWCSTQSTLMQTTTMISLCSDFNVLSPSQSKRISHLCDPLNLNPPPLRYILPICLPRPGLSVQGRRGYVTGWGRTYDGGPYPILLNQVNVRRRTTEWYNLWRLRFRCWATLSATPCSSWPPWRIGWRRTSGWVLCWFVFVNSRTDIVRGPSRCALGTGRGVRMRARETVVDRLLLRRGRGVRKCGSLQVVEMFFFACSPLCATFLHRHY